MSSRQSILTAGLLASTPALAQRRPVKVTALSLLCCALGPLCILLPAALLAGRGMPAEPLLWMVTAGMEMMGLFLTLAGVGLWRMEPWGVVAFALFVAASQLVRLPLALYAGPVVSVQSAVWTGLWLLITLYLWRTIKQYPKT